MADIKSPRERSLNMSRIQGKNTKPELFVRKALFRRGYRYRKNCNNILGRPDVWLKKYNLAVFVNGCFWHRHIGCKYAYIPKSRVEFWTDKFNKNIERDNEVKSRLKDDGIRVLVIWECTVKRMMKQQECEVEIMDKVEEFIHSEDVYVEF